MDTAHAFATHGYLIARGLLPAAVCAKAAADLKTMKAHNLLRRGEGAVTAATVAYKNLVTEDLLLRLLPQVEQLTGHRLLPTYSFMRIYEPGAVLARHTDRPACEISLSLALQPDPQVPWPLYVETPTGEAVPAHLAAGDGLVYQGIERPHWREPFTGTEMIQTFLHYVRADGPYAHLKADKVKPQRPPHARAPIN
ncbi:MAG: hypothetical protein RL514_3676 [Verrucomicrobiota bacterium]